MLLSQQLLPVMRDVSGALSCWKINLSTRFLKQSTPTFIRQDLRPPNSIELNPVDYKICGDIQQRVHQLLHSCTALTNWRSVCWTFGTAWTRASLTMQLMSGVRIFEPVWGQKAVISIKCCKLDNSIVCRAIRQDIFRFIIHDVCNLSQVRTLNFHR